MWICIITKESLLKCSVQCQICSTPLPSPMPWDFIATIKNALDTGRTHSISYIRALVIAVSNATFMCWHCHNWRKVYYRHVCAEHNMMYSYKKSPYRYVKVFAFVKCGGNFERFIVTPMLRLISWLLISCEYHRTHLWQGVIGPSNGLEPDDNQTPGNKLQWSFETLNRRQSKIYNHINRFPPTKMN